MYDLSSHIATAASCFLSGVVVLTGRHGPRLSPHPSLGGAKRGRVSQVVEFDDVKVHPNDVNASRFACDLKPVVDTTGFKFEEIGRGTLKVAYTADGDEDHVWLFPAKDDASHSHEIKREFCMLSYLHAIGVPDVVGRLALVETPSSGIRQEIVRSPTLFKPHNPESLQRVLEKIGIPSRPRLADHLQNVAETLKKHGVLVEDLQFLCTQDGRAVLVDPLEVKELSFEDNTYISVPDKVPVSRGYRRVLDAFRRQQAALQNAVDALKS